MHLILLLVALFATGFYITHIIIKSYLRSVPITIVNSDEEIEP